MFYRRVPDVFCRVCTLEGICIGPGVAEFGFGAFQRAKLSPQDMQLN